MAVDTKKVTGRRQLEFQTFDELLQDAELITSAEQVTSLGNWTPAQAVKHLAVVMEKSIDGFGMKAPWFVRLMLGMMKNRLLTKPVPAGFKLPKVAESLIAEENVSPEEAMAALRAAIERLKTEQNREPHPALGKLTLEQWDQLHRSHAAMHFSFHNPKDKIG